MKAARDDGARRQRIERAWTRRGPWRYALGPLAWAYRAALAGRRAAYRLGVVRTYRVGVPVVSIGNLTVGGTGKTPAALWLGEALAGIGLHPAIVSRGYGGMLGKRVATVGTGEHALVTPEEAGDEAVLLAERFAGPVVCGADRLVAARTAVAEHGADVILLDDGFQHWRLGRDFDLVLVDGAAGFGNGALLPAGPLREPLGALARAGAIVVTKAASATRVTDVLERRAAGVPVFAADLVARSLVQLEGRSLVARPLGVLAGRRVVTVSAIARPESFYELLGQWDVRPVEVLEYPDHHLYSQGDWQHITQAAHRADLVVCTEKDLVKLRRFPFARDTLVALRVDFALSAGDSQALLELICARIAAPARLRTPDERAS
jgi:tetraacyldisaccharide 4'-kinase